MVKENMEFLRKHDPEIADAIEEELEERIPVKIKVTRKGEGRSLVEIRNA